MEIFFRKLLIILLISDLLQRVLFAVENAIISYCKIKYTLYIVYIPYIFRMSIVYLLI